MAVVLSPILKSSSDRPTSKGASSVSRVKFDIPFEQINIIEYLKDPETVNGSKMITVIKMITSPDTEDFVLLKWIGEFKDNILFLDKSNERITFSLLNINWYAKDEDFVTVYEEFILNLVTAHTAYLRPVLTMIIRIFLPVSDANDISDEELQLFQNAHRLLKQIMILIPMSPHQLCIMLSEKFPYMKSLTHVMHCYVENILTVCSYLPEKRIIILDFLIEKLIHIDVHCSRETIEIYEIEKSESDQHQDIGDGDMADDKSSSTKNSMAFPLANNLDVMLDSVFNFIHNTCYQKDGSTLDWETTKKLYKELLTIFDKTVLSTCGCCHVQYIMFYICSLKQELCEGFLDYLWKKVQNPNVGSVFRQLAAFYIGSLLARSNYISISTVTACLELMCNWIHRYVDNHTGEETNVHGTFHSVCQTVFYVFAFRSKELIELKNGQKYLRSLNFDRIVTCRLNPLKYCDRTILQNFANISRNFQIAYVFPIIERNNRNLLYACAAETAENVAGAKIKTFFPFDPYVLKRSKHWIDNLYRVYGHNSKDDEPMEQDEDEMSTSDVLFSYSSSPGFKNYLLKT